MSSTRGHEPRSHLRQRSTSLPSFNEAQSALKYAQKHPARRLVAYFIVVAFLSAFLMLGFGSLRGAFDEMIVKGGLPDFESIPGDGIRTITAEELRAGGWKRFIVVGDVHGMLESWEKMLNTVQYNPETDLLVHVGDLVAKGPDSANVMKTISTHNVTGVRGNHDQKVIEWRGWIEWVLSQEGGRAWLEDMESRHLGETEYSEQKVAHKDGWKIPSGWKFGKEHYWIARGMTPSEAAYFSELPLVIHLPSYHLFIVHAGILPLNPTIPLNSKHQPLSHVPGSLKQHANKGRRHMSPEHQGSFLEREATPDLEGLGIESIEDRDEGSFRHKKPRNKHELRMLQEQLILSTIPQNTIPFNLLNIRSLKKNRPTRRSKVGRPWAEIWNSVLSRCDGFPDDAVDVALSEEGLPPLKDKNGKTRDMAWWEKLVYSPGDIVDWEEEGYDEEADSFWSRVPRKLPCNPSTVIYGHAAGRGLDVKRWSFGLDSGCVYGRRMTALVFSEQEDNLGLRALETGGDDRVEVSTITLGEAEEPLFGRLVSIGCPDVGA